MSEYHFLTTWKFDHPLAYVWDEIEDVDSWPEWWRGVLDVAELVRGDEDGVGSVRRTTWKSALPYKLVFDSEVVRVERHRCIEARAFGELDGYGIWTFESTGSGTTRVEYDWRVTTSKAWMNVMAPVARPVFRWNHDVIMRWGERGLTMRLASKAGPRGA